MLLLYAGTQPELQIRSSAWGMQSLDVVSDSRLQFPTLSGSDIDGKAADCNQILQMTAVACGIQ